MDKLRKLISQKRERCNREKPKYGMRKLTVGMVSCMIGYLVLTTPVVVNAEDLSMNDTEIMDNVDNAQPEEKLEKESTEVALEDKDNKKTDGLKEEANTDKKADEDLDKKTDEEINWTVEEHIEIGYGQNFLENTKVISSDKPIVVESEEVQGITIDKNGNLVGTPEVYWGGEAETERAIQLHVMVKDAKTGKALTNDPVTIIVRVKRSANQATQYNPKFRTIQKKFNDPVSEKDIKDALESNSVPEGTIIEFDGKPIDSRTSGTAKQRVKVKYKDGSTESANVTVIVNKQAQSEIYDIISKTYIEVDKGQKIDPSSAIVNLENLPEDIKVEWKDGSPDTFKVGSTERKIIVTFADGSFSEIELDVIVLPRMIEPKENIQVLNGVNVKGGISTITTHAKPKHPIEIVYSEENSGLKIDSIGNLVGIPHIKSWGADGTAKIKLKITGAYMSDDYSTIKFVESEVTITVVQSQADKITPELGDKTKVKNKAKLSEEERNEVGRILKDKNADKFGNDTKVDIDERGNATITYPDESKDSITADRLIYDKSEEKVTKQVALNFFDQDGNFLNESTALFELTQKDGEKSRTLTLEDIKQYIPEGYEFDNAEDMVVDFTSDEGINYVFDINVKKVEEEKTPEVNRDEDEKEETPEVNEDKDEKEEAPEVNENEDEKEEAPEVNENEDEKEEVPEVDNGEKEETPEENRDEEKEGEAKPERDMKPEADMNQKYPNNDQKNSDSMVQDLNAEKNSEHKKNSPKTNPSKKSNKTPDTSDVSNVGMYASTIAMAASALAFMQTKKRRK